MRESQEIFRRWNRAIWMLRILQGAEEQLNLDIGPFLEGYNRQFKLLPKHQPTF